MGIQDNIYDVQAALEGKPEAELFEELMQWAYNMENELERIQRSGPVLTVASKTYIQDNIVVAIAKAAEREEKD